MGCDYYEISYITVVFKDGTQISADYEKKPIYGYYFTHDEDMLNEFKIEEEKWINEIQTKKILYENNTWIITNPTKIDYYNNLLSQKGENISTSISQNNIQTIYTSLYRMKR